SLIQTAINGSKRGAVVCVNPGTYTGNLVFSGQAVTVQSTTPLGAILHGTGGTVVSFLNGDASTLDGFQITGGTGAGGGGIRVDSSSPMIQNCLVTGNTATASSHPQGAGAYIAGSKAAPLIRCTCFQGNHSNFIGGGLESAYLAHPYLSHDTFVSNTAPYGAGISVEFDGLVSVENSEFLANVANIDGGAVHVLGPFGNADIRRTVLLANTAGSNGGALWIPAGFATVLNSIFDSNKASNGGAAATDFDGVLTVESSILVNNTTTGGVGTAALSAGSAPATLVENFNLFFNNVPAGPGGTFFDTTGNLGNLFSDPKFGTKCYNLSPTSPALHTGLPDLHFNNTDGTRNSMGVYGGPTFPFP
ncbi:MAG TPA: hypothetical protein VOA87_20530, partial [Thermoanaerobaculia bacterium]|nr:hypothetical protein [Thermoanaerobaculia bacterium]